MSPRPLLWYEALRPGELSGGLPAIRKWGESFDEVVVSWERINWDALLIELAAVRRAVPLVRINPALKLVGWMGHRGADDPAAWDAMIEAARRLPHFQGELWLDGELALRQWYRYWVWDPDFAGLRAGIRKLRDLRARITWYPTLSHGLTLLGETVFARTTKLVQLIQEELGGEVEFIDHATASSRTSAAQQSARICDEKFRELRVRRTMLVYTPKVNQNYWWGYDELNKAMEQPVVQGRRLVVYPNGDPQYMVAKQAADACVGFWRRPVVPWPIAHGATNVGNTR